MQLGDDDDDEDVEPGLMDYVMHYLTLPWKVDFEITKPKSLLINCRSSLPLSHQLTTAADGFASLFQSLVSVS